jgi:plastocyanin
VRILALLFIAAALGGCTAGAPGSGSTSSNVATSAATTTIGISLTNSVVVTTAYGTSGGFSPAVMTVAVGTYVRFVNNDSFAHTSTSMRAATFPSAEPFDASALTESGTSLSGGWSTGALAPGHISQPLLADKPGTYLYGCFFHYGAPMRAAIVVH